MTNLKKSQNEGFNIHGRFQNEGFVFSSTSSTRSGCSPYGSLHPGAWCLHATGNGCIDPFFCGRSSPDQALVLFNGWALHLQRFVALHRSAMIFFCIQKTTGHNPPRMGFFFTRVHLFLRFCSELQMYSVN